MGVLWFDMIPRTFICWHLSFNSKADGLSIWFLCCSWIDTLGPILNTHICQHVYSYPPPYQSILYTSYAQISFVWSLMFALKISIYTYIITFLLLHGERVAVWLNPLRQEPDYQDFSLNSYECDQLCYPCSPITYWAHLVNLLDNKPQVSFLLLKYFANFRADFIK